MNKLAVIVAVMAAPFLAASTVTQGHLYGRFNDGVYLVPGKLFKMSSPFPEQPIVSDGRQPDNNNAGAVSFIDEAGTIDGQPAWIAVARVPNGSPLGLSAKDSYDVRRNDSWRGMAVVARGKHYYLLQTELRVEKLAPPNWSYDSEAANWNEFVPELEALYHRIEFLKP
jgi:hypothetical protein